MTVRFELFNVRAVLLHTFWWLQCRQWIAIVQQTI